MKGIVHSTAVVGTMYSFMDQIGIPIPNMPDPTIYPALLSCSWSTDPRD